jgi:hypothetical protein
MGLFQFFQWGILLQVLAVLHFLRRRPDTFWLWIIIFFGPLGAFIYILMEVVPDLGLIRHTRSKASDAASESITSTLVQNRLPATTGTGRPVSRDRRSARRASATTKRSRRATHADPFYRRGWQPSRWGLFVGCRISSTSHRKIQKYDSNRALGLLAHATPTPDSRRTRRAYFQRALEFSTLSET